MVPLGFFFLSTPQAKLDPNPNRYHLTGPNGFLQKAGVASAELPHLPLEGFGVSGLVAIVRFPLFCFIAQVPSGGPFRTVWSGFRCVPNPKPSTLNPTNPISPKPEKHPKPYKP